MMMINWFHLTGFPIPKMSLPDPSHWGDRNKNILDLWGVLYSLKILEEGGGGDLKRWGTYNSYYMIWVIVETAVSNNETPSHAD